MLERLAATTRVARDAMLPMTIASIGLALLAGVASSEVGTGEGEAIPRPKGRLARQVTMLPEPVAVPGHAFRERKPDGEMVERSIVDLRGRVVVLNFWASWCGVCRGEMPKLDALAGRLGEADLPVDVVALSIDDGIEIARRALAKRGHDRLRVFHDSQRVLAPVLGVRGVPTTFVIDGEGRAISMTQGPADWSSPESLAWLRELAGAAEPPPAPLPTASLEARVADARQVGETPLP